MSDEADLRPPCTPSAPPSAKQAITIGGGTITLVGGIVALLELLDVTHMTARSQGVHAAEHEQRNASADRADLRTHIEVIKVRLVRVDEKLEEAAEADKQTRGAVSDLDRKIDQLGGEIRRMSRRMRDEP